MRRRAFGFTAACALLLAACGTAASPGATGSSHHHATRPATHSTPNTAAPSSTGAPAVAQATDQDVEPVISPGTAPPPSKLVVVNLVTGTGATASASSTVEVKYVGADYTTGTDFTSSTWTADRPATFSLHGVVPGFAEGITGMKVGGRREIVIPPSLGYGPTGQSPAIKPNETLVFVVDLVGIK